MRMCACVCFVCACVHERAQACVCVSVIKWCRLDTDSATKAVYQMLL